MGKTDCRHDALQIPHHFIIRKADHAKPLAFKPRGAPRVVILLMRVALAVNRLGIEICAAPPGL